MDKIEKDELLRVVNSSEFEGAFFNTVVKNRQKYLEMLNKLKDSACKCADRCRDAKAHAGMFADIVDACEQIIISTNIMIDSLVDMKSIEDFRTVAVEALVFAEDVSLQIELIVNVSEAIRNAEEIRQRDILGKKVTGYVDAGDQIALLFP